MRYELIPLAERYRYHCCVCGTSRSVKYLMPVKDTYSGKWAEKQAYCNRCAILFSDLERRNSNE